MSEFDQVYDRSKSNSVKWDKYLGQDVLPLWVADMDFRSPQAVIDAIKQKADEGILSYGNAPAELTALFQAHLNSEYAWSVDEASISYLVGVVPAFNMACKAFVGEGEALITAVPVYTPILEVGENNNRELFKITAEQKQGQWQYPIEALEESLSENPHIRMLLLCNPFNPIGRALTEHELNEIVRICLAHEVVICSDEIHCELLFDDIKHIPIASLGDLAESICITLMAPTKTYNLAGIGGSIVIIKDEALRQKFNKATKGFSPRVSSLSFAAMLAAYKDCQQWKKELLVYLQENRDFLVDRVSKIKGLDINHVEATYLAWLDVSALGLNHSMSFFEDAGLGMSPGTQYEGDKFMRLNFACPRETLVEACDRMEKAIMKLD